MSIPCRTCPLLIALLLVSLLAREGLTAPPKFITVGKIVCGGLTPPSPKAGTGAESAEFYRTQIEILKTGELRRRALDRVRSMNPELKEIDIEIRVTLVEGTSIVEVATLGEEAKYTRIYLIALLDEYTALRKEFIENTFRGAAIKVVGEVLAREKEVKERSQKLFDGKKAGLPALDLEKLKEDYDRANQDCQHWKKTMDRIDPGSLCLSDPVTLLERPVVAIENR